MIKSNSILVAGLCLLVLAPATASAQIKKSGSGYLLRLKFKKGDIRKYAVDTSIEGISQSAGGSGQPISLVGTLQTKVLSVSGKSAKLEVNVGAMTFKGGGQPINQPQTTVVDVDELGNGKNAAGRAGIVINFPKNPVKVGGTWTAPIILPGASGATNTRQATYRFNGLKKSGKQTLADVTFALSDAAQMKGGTGKAMLNPGDGTLSSMSMKFSLAQGDQSLNTVIKITATK